MGQSGRFGECAVRGATLQRTEQHVPLSDEPCCGKRASGRVDSIPGQLRIQYGPERDCSADRSVVVQRRRDARPNTGRCAFAPERPAVPVHSEIIISRVQYSPAGNQTGFARTSDTASFLANRYTVPISGAASCSATVESDSPWLTVAGPNPVAGGSSLQYAVADNTGGSRTGNLILHPNSCNLALGAQVLAVNQTGFVCDPSFADPSTHAGFLDTVRSILIRATSPLCTWTVTSSAPWLKITSPGSGSGDGAVQVSAESNGDPALRQASLFINGGKEHRFYQDAAGNMLALSPLVAGGCGSQQAQFGASWITSADSIELRANSPGGAFDRCVSTRWIGIVAGANRRHDRVHAAGRSVARVGKRARSGSGGGLRHPERRGARHCECRELFTCIHCGGRARDDVWQQTHSIYGGGGRSLSERLGGVEVTISGVRCPLSFVSPGQINFIVPSGLPPGRHIVAAGGASAEVIVSAVSTGIFTLNGKGSGVPIASAIKVLSNGASVNAPVYACTGSACAASPVSISDDTQALYLVLHGTGFRNLKSATAVIGDRAAEVVYAGPQAQFPGVDQINLLMKQVSDLSGRQRLRIRADGIDSNEVEVLFQ